MAVNKATLLGGSVALACLLAVTGGYRVFQETRSHPTAPIVSAPAGPDEAIAVFAGGCFWCTEADFEKAPGVIAVTSGYTGGTLANPSYEQVSHEPTGHYEAVEVRYDPRATSYEALLDYHFEHVDPTDPYGQFVDQGPSYRSAIFYRTDDERRAAEDAKADLAASGVFSVPIATAILPADIFYAAEDYHQDYYKKNPVRYAYYRGNSGRDAFLASHWTPATKKKYRAARTASSVPVPATSITPSTFTKPSSSTLRATLTPLQYTVTQEAGTELPFDNAYWDEKRPGIYVDIVSGEPLFSSQDKYDSGTGWPSFTKPLVPENIVRKKDGVLFFPRIEIRSAQADSHLGHVFEDGPTDKGGLRYCMNSAALRFIPRERMVAEGYGAYLAEFPEAAGL